jgi:hypothetical protein
MCAISVHVRNILSMSGISVRTRPENAANVTLVLQNEG